MFLHNSKTGSTDLNNMFAGLSEFVSPKPQEISHETSFHNFKVLQAARKLTEIGISYKVLSAPQTNMLYLFFEWGILNDIKIPGIHLQKSNFESTTISIFDLSYADFSLSNFQGATLQYGDFSNANFSSSNFANALLSNVDLSGADLRDVVLLKTKFHNITIDQYTLLPQEMKTVIASMKLRNIHTFDMDTSNQCTYQNIIWKPSINT
jgi:uncharacterized protein YjbI with pentapeptide repeats